MWSTDWVQTTYVKVGEVWAVSGVSIFQTQASWSANLPWARLLSPIALKIQDCLIMGSGAVHQAYAVMVPFIPARVLRLGARDIWSAPPSGAWAPNKNWDCARENWLNIPPLSVISKRLKSSGKLIEQQVTDSRDVLKVCIYPNKSSRLHPWPLSLTTLL